MVRRWKLAGCPAHRNVRQHAGKDGALELDHFAAGLLTETKNIGFSEWFVTRQAKEIIYLPWNQDALN